MWKLSPEKLVKRTDPEEDDDIETGDNSETELSDEEQTAKLNEAEELLRKARERIK